MQIALGCLIYFAFELALGILTGKLLRHRRLRSHPAPTAVLVGGSAAVCGRLAAVER